MTDGSSAVPKQDSSVLVSRSRSWILVSCVVAVALVAVAACVTVTAVRLEPQSTSSGYPGGSASSVLYYGQSPTVFGLYEIQFTVPDLSGPGVPVKVEEVALMGISCGTSTYMIGEVDNCSMGLVNGTTGGATEDLLWSEYFSGYVASNVTLLSPGVFTLLIDVHAGSPPLAVIVVPFSVTVEIATLH